MKNLLILFIFPLVLWANQNLIINNESILMDKTVVKLEEMTNELHQKTGIGIYISAVESLKGKTVTAYGEELSGQLSGSYLLLVFASEDKQIELFMSPDVASVIDTDDILDDYIIPILVERRKDLSLQQQYSAAIFNGIAEVVDELAESQNIVLSSSVGSGSKDFYDGLSVVIKILLIFTFAALFYAYYKSKREKGGEA